MIRLYNRNIDVPELADSDPALIGRLAKMFEQERRGNSRLARVQLAQLGSLLFVGVACWLFVKTVEAHGYRVVFVMGAIAAWVLTMGFYGSRVAAEIARDFTDFVRERCPAGVPRFCMKCDYDLRGSTGVSCPECGEPIPQGDHPLLKGTARVRLMGRQFDIPELRGMPPEQREILARRFERESKGRNRLAMAQALQIFGFVLLLLIARAAFLLEDRVVAGVAGALLLGLGVLAIGLYGNRAAKHIREDFCRFVRDYCPDGKPRFCLQCDYDLRASQGATCPECGAVVPVIH